jgi:hypothetical protein
MRTTQPPDPCPLQLMGAGERKKSIMGPVAVNVYAIGLYVDGGAAKSAGAGVTDANSAAQVLKTGTFSKTLRLVMARTGKCTRDGFDRDSARILRNKDAC